MSGNNLQRANMERARKLLERFAPFDPSWLDVLHADIAIEFPFGEALGYPPRIEGKSECAYLYQLVSARLSLTFSDVEIIGMSDPNLVLGQYRGSGTFNENQYSQRYITLMGFYDEQLVLFKEHLDTNVVADTIGHLNVLTQADHS